MMTPPTDAPEEESSGVFAPADSEPAETPPAVTIMPPSPEDLARDNARGGRWAMNEYYDGCVLLGADDKPVMRNDGSRVGFFFRDAQRLADELAAGAEPRALPSGHDADDRAAAWRAQRRALAPLDSGFNKDWDPQRPKSTLADMTKWTRLLAYHYVQTTEPEEAVRHAVADIFGKPLNGPRMSLWVPGRYNVETVESVANGLLRRALGDEKATQENTLASRPMPTASLFSADQINVSVLGGVADGPETTDGLDHASETQYAQALEPSETGKLPIPPRRPGEFGGPKREAGQKQTIRVVEPKLPASQPQRITDALQDKTYSQAWLDHLATAWETKGTRSGRFDGYGTSLADIQNGVEGFALGRYQMRQIGLRDVGLIRSNGQWSGQYGILSWQDFMNNPQAQEAAVRDLLRKNEGYMRKFNAHDIGKTIKTDIGDITVTESGFLGACHKAGIGTMGDFFRWVRKNNWDIRGKAVPPRSNFDEIDRRLKDFQNIPYK